MLKKGFKKLLRNRVLHWFLSCLAGGYIFFVYRTTRWSVTGTAPRDRLHKEGKSFVLAAWHNRVAMTPYVWPEQRKKLTILASAHRDGRVLVKAVAFLGLDAICVEHNRPLAAIRQAVRTLKQGRIVVISPDGPRGPRFMAKTGALNIAAQAGVPIIPVTYTIYRRKILESWDKFVIPLPFGRGVIAWGEPLYVPRKIRDETLETCRVELEQALCKITNDTDQAMGHLPLPFASQKEIRKADLKAGEKSALPVRQRH